MARKPKAKSIDDTHNFGVPSSADEAKHVDWEACKEPQSDKKEIKKEIKHHAKFAKYKGREINGNE